MCKIFDICINDTRLDDKLMWPQLHEVSQVEGWNALRHSASILVMHEAV